MTKLMAIDFGEKRVGIASTDDSGEFALPRMVLPNDDELLQKLISYIQEESVEKVVMGESLNYQGEPNKIMEAAANLKRELEAAGVEVVLHPEVLTTMEARQIQGQTEMTDASAAALILKSYIDSQK
jgi:putative holliday junction resolvase